MDPLDETWAHGTLLVVCSIEFCPESLQAKFFEQRQPVNKHGKELFSVFLQSVNISAT